LKALFVTTVLFSIGCRPVRHEVDGPASLSIELVNCEEMTMEARTRDCQVCVMSRPKVPLMERQREIGDAVAQKVLDEYYGGEPFGDSVAEARKSGTAVYIVSVRPLRMPASTVVPFRPATSRAVAINEAVRLDRRVGFVEFDVDGGDDQGDFWVIQSDGFVTNRTVPGGQLADHYDAVATGVIFHCVRQEGGRVKVFRASTLMVDATEPRRSGVRIAAIAQPPREIVVRHPIHVDGG
jgi:hypothetical protein